MYHIVDLIALINISGYFKCLAHYDGIKSGDDFSITLPFKIQKRRISYFLYTVQTQGPHYFKLSVLLPLDDIFLLADFFQIESLFSEFEYWFQNDLKLGAKYLEMLLTYYGQKHPQTKFFINLLSNNFHTEPHKITSALGPNLISFSKLKNHLRNSKRSARFNIKAQREKRCFICKQSVFYRYYAPLLIKDAYMSPCCGSVFHIGCLEDYKALFSCPICITDLELGKPNIFLEKELSTRRRKERRMLNGIPEFADLPVP